MFSFRNCVLGLCCCLAVFVGMAGTAKACDVACGTAVAVQQFAYAAPVQTFAVQSYAVPSVAVLATPVFVQQQFVHGHHGHRVFFNRGVRVRAGGVRVNVR